MRAAGAPPGDWVRRIWRAVRAKTSDFPCTPGAFDTTFGGEGDGFVASFDPLLTGLRFSTFLGGSGLHGSFAIALDSAGGAVVPGAGSTRWRDLAPHARTVDDPVMIVTWPRPVRRISREERPACR